MSLGACPVLHAGEGARPRAAGSLPADAVRVGPAARPLARLLLLQLLMLMLLRRLRGLWLRLRLLAMPLLLLLRLRLLLLRLLLQLLYMRLNIIEIAAPPEHILVGVAARELHVSLKMSISLAVQSREGFKTFRALEPAATARGRAPESARPLRGRGGRGGRPASARRHLVAEAPLDRHGQLDVHLPALALGHTLQVLANRRGNASAFAVGAVAPRGDPAARRAAANDEARQVASTPSSSIRRVGIRGRAVRNDCRAAAAATRQ